MEPEEGQHVGSDNNCNFSQLINRAVKRGLKPEKFVHAFAEEFDDPEGLILSTVLIGVKRWKYKYKPDFTLRASKTTIHPIGIDENAEPSDWLENKEYRLLLSIINKNTQKPGIRLSAQNVNAIDG